MVVSSAMWAALNPPEVEPFLALYTLGRDKTLSNYYAGGSPDLYPNDSVLWYVGVYNHMGLAQYLEIRFKLLNGTLPSPNEAANQPSNVLPFATARQLVDSNGTFLIPAAWSIANVASSNETLTINSLQFNGVLEQNLNISAKNGYNFRMVIELWVFDPQIGDFVFWWPSGTEKKSSWNQVWFNVPVQSKSARLDASALPNPVQIAVGQSVPVAYRLSDATGVGVTLASEQWVFAYPDGSNGPSGTATDRIRIDAHSSVYWTRWPQLPPEVAGRAAANGWQSVVLRYTFVGADDNGDAISASYDVTIILVSASTTATITATAATTGTTSICTTNPFVCALETIVLFAGVAVAVLAFRRARRMARREKVEARRQISNRRQATFCINCGIQLPLGAKHCDDCGANQP